MKKLSILIIGSMILFVNSVYNQPIIADHQSTDLDEIPIQYIEQAKAELKIWYGHTSHGGQITSGMQNLASHYGDPYNYNYSGSGGALSYQELWGMDLGHNGDLSWYYATIDQLEDPGNDRNVVVWSWCGGVSDNTPEGINIYLDSMNQLEQNYPDVMFVYMTGHLDIWSWENLKARNQQIRNYCIANNKILFDFADIESYDPDHTFYEYAHDNCNYYQGPGWGYLGNWADEWCAAHPGSDLCWSCSCAHSKPLNCNLKGRAFWWMLAKMAGWNHQGSIYFVNKNHPAASNTNPGTADEPWLTIQHAADVAQAGDSVVVREGIYNESVTTQHNGSADNGDIVFAAYPGEEVIIDGSGGSDNTGFTIVHDYIKLYGLKIANWENTGIWIQDAAYFELHDLEVYEMIFGIGIAGDSHDFLVNGCEVHHFDLYGIDASPLGDGYCYNGLFTDCAAHTARDPEQNVDGFALGHGDQNSFVFENCRTWDVYDGFDISATQSTLYSCKAYNCDNACFKLWEDQVELVNCLGISGGISIVQLGWRGYQTETILRNCTFHGAGVYTIWQANQNDILNMHNCIISGGENIGLGFEQPSATNYHGDYNLFQNNNPLRAISVGYTDEFSIEQIQNGTWTAYSGEDSNSGVGNAPDEIYLLPFLDDLHLCRQSPAIDNAHQNWAPDMDFDGMPRPYGSADDIGCFESQGTFLHTHTIELEAGWNGISSYVIPSDLDITTLFDQISEEIIIVQNMHGIYWPGQGINTLVNWEPEKGYQLKVGQNAELILTGEPAENPAAAMDAGWNLIAIPSPCNLSIDELDAQIGSELVVLKEAIGIGIYWPEMNIQTIEALKTGSAYYILVANNCTITFPGCE